MLSLRESSLLLSNLRRQCLAGAYRRLTQRSRMRWSSFLAQRRLMPVAILFYHRVADRHPNAWTISSRGFVRHLDWLQQHCDLVSLGEAQQRIVNPHNDRLAVAITFDDGYAENCDFALPELLRRGIPVTYFVATDHVAQDKPFPHDLQLGRPLKPNTIDQLQELRRAGIEMGAHTRSHADIGRLADQDELASEILGSRQQLLDWDLGPVRYFSFPYGLPANTSQSAVDLLYRSGFAGFCTAYGAWNWPGSCGYHLRRIHADPGLQTLVNWLSLDARKLDDRQRLPFREPNARHLQPSPVLPSFPQCCNTFAQL